MKVPFFDPGATPEGGLHAPATLRNRDPILAVLGRVLPPAGTVLEIASGTGEHAAFFAAALPAITWQPTDPDPRHLASIAAWRHASRLPNLLPPLCLDVLAEPWPVGPVDAIFVANLLHISPRSVIPALMAGAAARLPPGGRLVVYGPFLRQGRHTADSNARFDERLRAEDPRWGVRDLAEVSGPGLFLEEVVQMPANNLTLVLRRA